MGTTPTAQRSISQWWSERQRKWPWVVAAVLLFLFIIGSVFGDDEQKSGGSPEEPPAVTLPDGLKGLDSASARDQLEKSGFVVTIESVDGRMVLMESNWTVVSASLRDNRYVLLRVEKPAPTPVAPPSTAEVPTTTEPPPVQVAPVPEPEPPVPEPEPAPAPVPDAYYANCTEARAAGAAPLTAGAPGYRAALDRDKDGVACE